MDDTISAKALLAHLEKLEYLAENTAPAIMAAALETFGRTGHRFRKAWAQLAEPLSTLAEYYNPELDEGEDLQVGAAIHRLHHMVAADPQVHWSSPGVLWVGPRVSQQRAREQLKRGTLPSLGEPPRTLFIVKAFLILRSAGLPLYYKPSTRARRPRRAPAYAMEVASRLLVELGVDRTRTRDLKRLYRYGRAWLTKEFPGEVDNLTSEIYRKRAARYLRDGSTFGFPTVTPQWVQTAATRSAPSPRSTSTGTAPARGKRARPTPG